MFNFLLGLKFFRCLSPCSKDNAAFDNNTAVDTRGLSGVLFVIESGALAAAVGSSGAGNALKIEECDTVGGSYTDVDDAALADAIANSEDNVKFAIFIDLRKTHKRFMRVNAPTAGDGTGTASFLAIYALGIPDVGPKDATEMGLAELITA
jgi:hypothetical protein